MNQIIHSFFHTLALRLNRYRKITFCHEGKWERCPNCIQPSTPESRLQLTRKLVLQTHTHNRYRKFNFNYLFQTDFILTCETWILLKILQMRPLQNSFMAARWKKASEKLRGFIWPVHPHFFEKQTFSGHPTCSKMFFYQQDHRELRYSQSHCEGDRPRNTAKREERHLKLFVEEDEKTLPKEKKGILLFFFTFKTNPNRPVSMYILRDSIHILQMLILLICLILYLCSICTLTTPALGVIPHSLWSGTK